MFRRILFAGTLIAGLAAMTTGTTARAEEPTVHPELKSLLPFVGKTWRGEFVNSTPEKPFVDVSKWELILNGQAMRIMHSLNDGMYGGETLVYWDTAQESLAFFYATTAGFQTTGKMQIKGDVFTAHEFVTGSSEGITEVSSESTLLPDGRMHMVSRYLKNGEWVPGHEAHYEEADDAIVIFKHVNVATTGK